jgi:tryptophanyl-tRNA synthetase
MLSHPSSTLLQRTFSKYATAMSETGSCKMMSLDNLTTFLEKHQNQEAFSKDELSEIMRKHMNKVYN